MDDLTPRQIVAELDRYVVGQDAAKRAVAVALRNRWRRRQLPEEARREVIPKNILMIGPTGVGKTEIARRLAALTRAPFFKVEATKYTEVGYHGRDVESVVRDLVEVAMRLVRDVEREKVRPVAEERANARLVDLLVPHGADDEDQEEGDDTTVRSERRRGAKRQRVKERLRQKLADGELEERKVTLRTESRQTPVQIFSNLGMEQMDVDLQNMFERIIPREPKQRELTVREARNVLIEQEVEQLIDREAAGAAAVRLAEESGIIFIDELDKICGPKSSHGPDVSRQGVQRDLLPIVEGTAVQTRYGTVHTDHILFVAAGAFHVSKPADLMPELQGRFPIRVELQDLTHADFTRILREPKNALTRQYADLLATEGVHIVYTDDGINTIAEIAFQVNKSTENIGARRLHTLMEKLLEGPSYDAPECGPKEITIDRQYVLDKLAAICENQDLSRYIL